MKTEMHVNHFGRHCKKFFYYKIHIKNLRRKHQYLYVDKKCIFSKLSNHLNVKKIGSMNICVEDLMHQAK